MAIFEIRTLGDPVLREQCREVTTFDAQLRRLADTMLQVMDRAGGVGLAASQVGVLKRLVVCRHPKTNEVLACVNPVITECSDDTLLDTEGCLSIPSATVEVPRAAHVVVQAQDLEGAPFVIEADELPARIIQHEMDHLDGVLILDRTSPEERRRVLQERAAAKLAEARHLR